MSYDMHRVIAHLADEPAVGGEEGVTKLFELTFNHSLEWVKLILAFALSLLSALVLAYFKPNEIGVHVEHFPWAVGGSLLTALAGAVHYWRIRGVRWRYAAALRLYAQLETALPFLKEHFPTAYKSLL